MAHRNINGKLSSSMPKLKINKKLEPLFNAKQQIIVLVGGRGSGKSLGVGDFLTFKMETEGADILCLREFQGSIADSVHRVFEGSVKDRLGLEGWDIQRDAVIAPNGARTRYIGANRNPDSMQSAQGYKYSWFEEAHRASQESIDKLLPTVLRNPGAKCIFTANPQSSEDAFSKRFITPYLEHLERDGRYEDDLHLIITVNWKDNPWWNKEQENLRQWDYENLDRSKYDWIWEGKFNDSIENSLIKPEWFDAAIDACKTIGIKPTGARVTSFDPSDEGEDAKGYASRIGIHYDDVGEIDIKDGNDACDEACLIARRNQSDLFVFDGDGMGAMLRRQIAENFEGTKVDTRMYRGSNSVENPDAIYEGAWSEGQKTNKDMFYNKRAQYYVKLALRFYNTYRAVIKNEYVDPDELISIDGSLPLIQKLRAEICRIPRKSNATGKIQLMPKQEMKSKHGIASPNMADCLAMAQESPKIKLETETIEFDSLWG